MTENEALLKGDVSEEDIYELKDRIRLADSNQILLADHIEGEKNKYKDPGLYLLDDDRETHMHIMGSSGGGKSKLLEFMIRQDIKRGVGVCIIDPHGELYWNILRYIILECDKDDEVWPKVYLINPSQKDYMVSFNPLLMKSGDFKTHSKRLISCLEKVWDIDINDKPGIKKALKAAFYTAAKRKLSINEVSKLLYKEESRIDLVDSFSHSPLGNDRVEEYWKETVRTKKYNEILFGADERLDALIDSEPLEFMAMQKKSLDLREVIENKGILLVNLATTNTFDQNSSKTLGTMLVSELLSNFKGDENTQESFMTGIKKEGVKPFFMYVDEFHEVFTDDFKSILSGGRKFHLHLILANQDFSQLTEEMKTSVKSVGTKAYFPVRDFHEAEEVFIQMGVHEDRIKDKYLTYANLKNSEYEMPTETVSTNSRGEQTRTIGRRTVSNFNTVETEHKIYYTPEEIRLMEGKKIQLLKPRNFLFHSKSRNESAFLKTDWVFDYPVEKKFIERFHKYVAEEHFNIYEKREVLEEKLRDINNPNNIELTKPVPGEQNSESLSNGEEENPFN
jgi:hypothetical protein